MNVTIYQHGNFRGKSQNLPVGRYNMAQLTIGNDQLSSLKVPNGLKVTLYQHANFRGTKRTYTKDVPFTADFNDATSSIVVEYRMSFFPNANNYYKMTVSHSGKVVDVSGHSTKNGGNIHQWDWHGGDNQLWKFIPTDNGYYKIVSKKSGKVIDVAGGKQNNGANIHQWQWHGGPNQHWKLDLLADGSFKITARHSGRCLDVAGVSKKNGANFHQWQWHGGGNQRFKLQKITAGKPVLKFDGKNDMVTAAVNVSEKAYTASIWFKTTHDNCGIFSVDAGDKGAKGHDRHIYLKGGNLCARLWKNETIKTSGVDYADGEWHCVTHVFGGGIGGQRLYVDGVLKAQGKLKASVFGWQDGINLGFSNDGQSDYFQGEIAQVSIWSVARSERDIKSWEEQLTGNESGLQLFWDFSTGKGNIVKDRSKNKLNGTIIGSATWAKSDDFSGAFIPTIIPEEINSIRNEGETLSKVATTLGNGFKDNPPADLPQQAISALVSAGKMPQYDLMTRLKGAVRNNELSLTKDLLGDFGKIGDVVGGLVDVFIKIKNPKIEFAKGKPGMVGAPGMEVLANPTADGNLATPEDHALKVSGTATLFSSINVELKYADFFHYKGKPHCSFKFLLPDPIGIGRFLPDVPVVNGLTLAGPTIIAATASTLYDPSLDSGINEGFNFFGNFKVADSTSKEIRFVGDLLKVKELAFHAAIDTSGTTPEYIFEMAVQRDITIINGKDFKLRFTRSDFGIAIKGKPPEPSFSLSNDLVVSLKEGNKDTHLVFTGGVKIEPESVTGSFTMNGTGRSPQGALSGSVQSTGEWKNPFGIPGITIRQMAVQLGLTYAAPWIDNIGVHGNLKVGDIDGSISVLVDANDPDQFVLAGSTEEITLIQIVTAMSPATFIAYQAQPKKIRDVMNKVIDVSMQDVKINIVPSACSIGGVHFRDEGVTLMGRLNLWGWNASAFLNIDTFDGLTVRADMDPINIANVFIVSGAQGDPAPILRLQISPNSTPYLYVSAKIQLLALSQELRIEANKDGFEFLFERSISNILNTSLTCSYNNYELAAAGSINFNLNVSIPTTFGNIKLVDIGFNAASQLKAGKKSGFYMKVSGSFRFYGSTVTFPTLELHIAPKDFRAVYNAVIKKIKDAAEQLFKAIFGTLGKWANAVKNGAIQFAGEVANVAKNVYRATEQAAISAYKTLSKGATDVARGLKNAYRKTKEQVASLMKGANYTANQVGGALKSAYNVGAKAVAQALKSARYGVNEVGKAVKSAFNASARATADALKYAGYGANAVGGAVKSAYNASARATADALKYAGYGVNEVGGAVKTAFNATASTAADALRYAGYGVNEVGNFAKDAYGLGADALNTTLKGVGYAAGEVEGFFKDLGGEFANFFGDVGDTLNNTFNPTKW